MIKIPNNHLGLSALAVFIFLALLKPTFAVQPEEMMKNPEMEKRARIISADLRCLVCQNQSIDDSNAPLAKDLRVIVRERIAAGDDDEQVVEYIVARYGNYVLLKPPLQTNTALLWFAPYLMIAAALGVMIVYFTRRPALPDDATSAASPTQEQEN
jgi:cytochrome c-type biogenesis protein CcmH